MYIHIGGEYSVSDKYIIGIFDLDNTTGQPSATIDFLNRKEQADALEVVSPEIPRSFVVTLDRVYVTPISPATLRRRLIRPDGTSRLAWGRRWDEPTHERWADQGQIQDEEQSEAIAVER
jgi:extracellular matrix regulatory protein B